MVFSGIFLRLTRMVQVVAFTHPYPATWHAVEMFSEWVEEYVLNCLLLQSSLKLTHEQRSQQELTRVQILVLFWPTRLRSHQFSCSVFGIEPAQIWTRAFARLAHRRIQGLPIHSACMTVRLWWSLEDEEKSCQTLLFTLALTQSVKCSFCLYSQVQGGLSEMVPWRVRL